MIKRLSAAILAIALSSLPLTDVLGHSGGTNAAGCHTNHSTGDYHCHTAKTPSLGRTNYCHVVNNENRCGYALRTCNSLVSKFGGYCVRQQ